MIPKFSNQRWRCFQTQGIYELLPWPVGRVYVPRKCYHNEVAGLSRRLSQTGKITDPMVLDDLYLICEKLFESLRIDPVEPWTIEEYLDERKGRVTAGRMNQLIKAADTLRDSLIVEHDARIEVFIKKELLLKPGIPRIIMPTSDRYLIELARFIGPIEKRLCESKWFTKRTSKGMTYLELGYAFNSLVTKFVDPVCYCVDFSKYDAHVGAELLQLEHYIYNRILPSTYMAYLLSFQTVMKGRVKFGNFKRTAGRASGCPNTTLGNTLLSILVHESLKRRYNAHSAMFLCIGDDSLIIAERMGQFWPDSAYEEYGLKAKIIPTEIAGAQYCSGLFMPTDDGFCFVREANRMLRKLPRTVDHKSEEQFKKLMHDKLHADLILMPKYPIISVLLFYWHSKYECGSIDLSNLSWTRRNLQYGSVPEQVKIDHTSRLWFEKVYDISPVEQQVIEKSILETGWHPTLTQLTRDSADPLERENVLRSYT